MPVLDFPQHDLIEGYLFVLDDFIRPDDEIKADKMSKLSQNASVSNNTTPTTTLAPAVTAVKIIPAVTAVKVIPPQPIIQYIPAPAASYSQFVEQPTPVYSGYTQPQAYFKCPTSCIRQCASWCAKSCCANPVWLASNTMRRSYNKNYMYPHANNYHQIRSFKKALIERRRTNSTRKRSNKHI